MKKSTLILITILAVGAIFSIILQIFILPNRKSNSSNGTQKPTPIITVLPTPTISRQFSSPKEKLINLLPVKEEAFTMEYLSSEDAFIVLIKTTDLNEGKTTAINWLEAQGINNWEELDFIWGGGKRP
jgi:hypothetical protein